MILVDLVLFEVILPDLPALGTSAEHLWLLLQNHPTYRAWRSLQRAFLNRTVECNGFPAALDCNDDHAANDRYFHATICAPEACDPKWLRDRVICMNHQNQHCLNVYVIGIAGYPMVNGLFSMSMFLAMSTHFIKCIVALPHICDNLDVL